MTYKPYSTIKATGFEFGYTNTSGSTMPKATPIKIKADGDIDFIDVSIEEDVFALGGVTSNSSLNLGKAGVVTAGRVEDVDVLFAFGDPVYISKAGALTNIKPALGVAGFVSGDFIVRIGIIGKNETNPLAKDLILDLGLIGQLE